MYSYNKQVREVLKAHPVSEPVAKPLTDEQLAMLNFLYGSGEWDGVWFEQPHPKKKGAFWWRSDLRRLFGDAPSEPDCPKCGNNRQVWNNQITGLKTCHRVNCHTVIQDFPPAPQRPWVGLTDEQFTESARLAEDGNYLVAFQRIQQWLKEKNTP